VVCQASAVQVSMSVLLATNVSQRVSCVMACNIVLTALMKTGELSVPCHPLLVQDILLVAFQLFLQHVVLCCHVAVYNARLWFVKIRSCALLQNCVTHVDNTWPLSDQYLATVNRTTTQRDLPITEFTRSLFFST